MDASATVKPPLGAAPVKVTVMLTYPPLASVVGLTISEDKLAVEESVSKLN